MATTTARTYKIDKSHSEAIFQVRHLVTRVRGRFSDFEGTIVLDEANPERSSVEFTIQATSIDTNEPDRDKHLRSDDFFAVEQFKTSNYAQMVEEVRENCPDLKHWIYFGTEGWKATLEQAASEGRLVAATSRTVRLKMHGKQQKRVAVILHSTRHAPLQPVA